MEGAQPNLRNAKSPGIDRTPTLKEVSPENFDIITGRAPEERHSRGVLNLERTRLR